MTWTLPRCLVLFAAAAAVTTACADYAETPVPEPVVRDSAGVTIVENTAAQWGEGEGWRLSERPVLEIGVVDGPEEYQLFRVVGSTRLQDGGVAIANFGTHQIRFYGPEGRYRRSVGGAGRGPGEFEWMALHRLSGDTLLVYDQLQRRLSFFSAAGELLDVVSVDGLGTDNVWFIGRLDDGAFVVRDGSTSANIPPGAGTGIVSDTTTFVLQSAAATRGDTIARLPAGERFMLVEEGRRTFTTPPFARSTFATTWGDRLFVGTGHRYEILVYGRPGRPSTLIRHPRPNLEVTPRHIAHFREERLSRAAGDPDAEARARRMLDEMPFPEKMPGHGRLQTDASGNLWVAHYRPSDEGQPRWDVFGPEGEWLGVVDTPVGFAVHEIGDDYLLGVYRDDFDVEYVRMYGLDRTGV